MNEEEEEDLCDHYFDIIIRRRTIPKRTNWRHHANALSQHEVALAAYDYFTFIFILMFFIFILMFFTRQMIIAISATHRAIYLNSFQSHSNSFHHLSKQTYRHGP
jgi:hypothetical protein